MEHVWPTPESLTVAPSVELARCDDYDAGDPSLDLVKKPDGKFEFVIYCGSQDLTVYDQSAKQVREVARRILALVPEE